VLVDRLWPRGLSKERAHLSEWRRELSPSTELRRWFGHDPARWEEFCERYHEELRQSGGLEALRELRRRARERPVTLVFGSREREHNNAQALLRFARAMR
jgi:uncharacterized protein YeaO (DUF488 family)